MTHILHVPNHNDRTTVFQVESDLQFISGPSAVAIGGGDVVDYPLTILPKRQGVFSGAVAFVAQTISRPHRYTPVLVGCILPLDTDSLPHNTVMWSGAT